MGRLCRKLPNMALTAATRTPFGDKERVLLEVANLSDLPSETRLNGRGGNCLGTRNDMIALPAKASKQIILTMPEGTPTLHAKLPSDALEIDNAVVLTPAPEKPVRCLLMLRTLICVGSLFALSKLLAMR